MAATPAVAGQPGRRPRGVTRRDFVERATLAAAGVLLAACDAGPVAPVVPTGGPYTIPLADYPDLARVGGVARVDLGGGQFVGVGRVSQTEFAAYGLACTHQGTQVEVSGSGWVCRSHDAAFDVAGQAVRGPATRALAAVPVTYDAAAGTLTINDASVATSGQPGTGGVGGTGDDDDGEDDGEGDDD